METLEQRQVLSGDLWLAVFRNFSGGGTLDEQARAGQAMLTSNGVPEENVLVVQAFDYTGVFLLQTPEDTDEEVLEEELEDIPGFVRVEEFEEVRTEAGVRTPAGSFSLFAGPTDEAPPDETEPLPPAGTWANTANAPTTMGTMMLLSDGSVLAQGGGVTNNWYKLTPSPSTGYAGGIWTQVSSMGLQRLYGGSNVLPDGRVFFIGGEYSGPLGSANWINTAEIYDPVANMWTATAPFPRSSFGDGQTAILPDGRILAGYLSTPETFIYDPATNTWSTGGSKLHNDRNNEETWNLLPDGSVLVYDVFSSSGSVGHSQRYIPATNTWVDAGDLPLVLSSSSLGSEMGPALLLPDGRVLMIGANNKTALYTPATETTPQSWAAGPQLPANLGADNAPGAIMPNGHVIFAVDTSVPNIFTPPTRLFEFDPTNNSLTELTGQPGFPSQLTTDLNHAAYTTRMLMLPTGQMLFAPGTSSRVYLFNPDGAPSDSWRPTITSIVPNSDGSYHLTGTQLNGISEGASYGDDAEMSTNYPIVQLRNTTTGNVYYGRTYDWSNTGVATGSLPVTTEFTLPVGLPVGSYSLAVVANGIASAPVAFNMPVSVTTTAPAAGAVVTSSPPQTFVVNFSSAIDPVSLQAADLLVNGSPADSVILDGSHTSATFTYIVSPVAAQGVQSLALPAGSLSADGNPSITITGYYANFRYDSPVLAVASTVPPASGVFTFASSLSYVVNFNEPIAPNSLSTDDLSVTAGSVGSVVASGPSQATYTINNITAEGNITITLGAGKVTDAAGNPLTSAFASTYAIDYGTTAYPIPLQEKSPAGSQIYDPILSGIVTFAGDTDTFTIPVDPSQTISVLVTPTSSGLQPSVQILDPLNAVVGSSTAAAAGQPAVIQTVGPTTSGTYRVVVSGDAGTTGNYSLQVVLNAAIENEGPLGGVDNNSIANAQDINGSFISISKSQASAVRGAVTGRTGYNASSVVPATFTNISSSGAILSSLTGADNVAVSTTIPFAFNFYGTNFTSVFVSSNGLMTFSSSATSGANSTLAGNPTQAAIAPFWDDLRVTNTLGSGGSNTATVRTQTTGTSPNRQFIIQWDKVTFAAGGATTDPITFQAILSEGTNTIQFNYLDLVSSTAAGNEGASATIGIKKANATNGQFIELVNNSGPNVFAGTGKSTLITPADAFDYYKFTLNAGDTSTIALTGQTTGTWNLELRNSIDGVLQTGGSGTNVTKVINNFVASTSDTYYLRVASDANVPYSLVVTKNAAFDTEPNDSFDTAQSIDGNVGALGSSAQLVVAPSILATTDGNFDNAYPFNIADVNVTSMRYQQIYARSEFAQPGVITAIRFRRDALESTFTTTGIDLQINLGYSATSYAAPSTTFASNVGAGTTTVLNTTPTTLLTLSSTSTTVPRAFDIVIPLTTPFTYDPAQGDLLMDIFMRNSPLTRYFDASTSNQEATTRRIVATNVANLTGSVDSTFTGLVTRFDMAPNDDWYSVAVNNSTALRFETSTPADGANQFVNTFDPRLELYDPSNVLVASGGPLADGRNEAILYTPVTTGNYRLRVVAEAGTTGEYALSRSKVLFWDPDGNPANNNLATGAGLGGTGTWDTSSAFWFNGVTDVPWNNANNDVAVFFGTTAGGTAGPVTLGTGITAAGLTFRTNSYSVTGSTLTLVPGQVEAVSGVTATISSQISGTSGVFKTGLGTVVLSNATNNYTGVTNVHSGTLRVGIANSIPATSAVSVFQGGTLSLNNLSDSVGSLAGAGGVTSVAIVSGGSGYITPPTVTFSGGGGSLTTATAILTGGVVTSVTINSPGAGYTSVPTVTFSAAPSGGTTATGTAVVTGGSVTLGSATLTTGGDNSSTIFVGVISGTGGVTKTGSGTFTYTGTNTYSGVTNISGGALRIGNNSTTGSLGTGSVTNSTTLIFNRTVNYSLANVISGSGGVSITTGQVDFTGANTYSGTTTISAGSLYLGFGTTTGSLSILSPIVTSATFGSQRTNTLTQGIDFASVISGTGSFLQFNSTGTTVLNGLNTYTGQTNIGSGTSGGTISFNSIKNVSGGSSALGAPTTTANGTIGVGSTTAAGTLVYTGSGNTTDRVINLRGTTGGVTLDQSGTGLLKFTTNLTATGAGIKTLTLRGSTIGTGEIAGAIVNNSATNTTSLVKTGTGTWVLSGNSTYTGTTTINGGTLLVTGNIASSATTVNSGGTLGGTGTTDGVTVNSGGILAPGLSPGTLFTGNLVLNSGATYRVELNSPAPGNYDQTDVTGSVNLGGATLNLQGSYVVNPALFVDSFTILDNDGSDPVIGTFAGLPEGSPISFGGGTLFVSYHGGDGNDVVVTRNLSPLAVDDSASTNEEFLVLIDVLANDNDPDGTKDPTTVIVINGPAHGSYSINPIDGKISYTPALNYNGSDSFTYRYKDNHGALSNLGTVNITIAPINDVTGFDVQHNAIQRSYIRYLDLLFENSEDLTQIMSSTRTKLTRYGLDGVSSPTAMNLTGIISATGNQLSLDFGAQGIGGNRNTIAGDGYYTLAVDTDGDGLFETNRSFYRLFGDANGDRQVTQADADLIYAAYGQTGSNLNADINGDGSVNSVDRGYSIRSIGKKLVNGLWLDD